ncbi:MAG: pyruvate kinase [Sedimentisphaerales bacterium]|nr:pyruvate kinase [Sedimentisphaerales bacterium]
MIKTKIIATLGPACAETGIIEAMIDNGVDVFRLNFSHGMLDEHEKLLETLHAARSGRHQMTAVLGDLCGPKIRTGSIEPEGQMLQAGDKVCITPGNQTGTAHSFGTNYDFFNQDVQIGHRIFIDDGQITLNVVGQDGENLICEVVDGGPLYSHKGINLPDTMIRKPSITEFDWECVDWAIERDLDFLALSFVRSANEIKQLKEYIHKAGSDIKVIAKIETPQALAHLEPIVDASDAVLVARGDLGVEMDLAEVPLIQKRITKMCRDYGKPAIVATQMLQSMIQSPTATRAEVSDVANAIMDFTDAVMLSGETAVGKYPVKAAQTIERIARVTEAYLDKLDSTHPRSITTDELLLTAAMARSVGQIVEDIDAKLVAVWSQSGSSARFLSKTRIDVPILALSSDERSCRQMCLHYGVIPCCQPIPEDISQFTSLVDKLILDNNWAQAGDMIILMPGQPISSAGTTNSIHIHKVKT